MCRIICTIIIILNHSLLCVVNFMLPKCSPNVAEEAWLCNRLNRLGLWAGHDTYVKRVFLCSVSHMLFSTNCEALLGNKAYKLLLKDIISKTVLHIFMQQATQLALRRLQYWVSRLCFFYIYCNCSVSASGLHLLRVTGAFANGS
jgi:hypothetical protein